MGTFGIALVVALAILGQDAVAGREAGLELLLPLLPKYKPHPPICLDERLVDQAIRYDPTEEERNTLWSVGWGVDQCRAWCSGTEKCMAYTWATMGVENRSQTICQGVSTKQAIDEATNPQNRQNIGGYVADHFCKGLCRHQTKKHKQQNDISCGDSLRYSENENVTCRYPIQGQSSDDQAVVNLGAVDPRGEYAEKESGGVCRTLTKAPTEPCATSDELPFFDLYTDGGLTLERSFDDCWARCANGVYCMGAVMAKFKFTVSQNGRDVDYNATMCYRSDYKRVTSPKAEPATEFVYRAICELVRKNRHYGTSVVDLKKFQCKLSKNDDDTTLALVDVEVFSGQYRKQCYPLQSWS